MAHLVVHKGRVKRRINAGKNDLSTGTIAEITYRRPNGEQRTGMYLIVNSYYKGKVHVLDLDQVPLVKLQSLTRYTDSESATIREIRGIEYSKLVFNIDAKKLYDRGLKNKIVTKAVDNYKVLDRNNIKKVFIIDYKWD